MMEFADSSHFGAALCETMLGLRLGWVLNAGFKDFLKPGMHDTIEI